MQKKGNWFYKDLPVVLSTNDAVLDLLKEVKAPCIVSAEKQTKGRGRLGRTWTESDGNLYVSFAYEIDAKNIGHYAVMSAVAVLNTIRFFSPYEDVKIKWPNDVFVGAKKISGVLFEKAFDDYWVMGIGINVARTPNVKNPMYEITSLFDLGVETNRLSVLEKLVEEFDKLKECYEKTGFPYVKGLWLDNAYQRGKKITIKQNGNKLSGILKGLDDNAGLIVETKEGLKTVYAGDVFFESKE